MAVNMSTIPAAQMLVHWTHEHTQLLICGMYGCAGCTCGYRWTSTPCREPCARGCLPRQMTASGLASSQLLS